MLDSLLIDLNNQLSLLNKLVAESKSILEGYKTLILAILKKNLINTNNLLISRANTISFENVDNFYSVQLALQAHYDEITSRQAEQNIFVSSQILLDVSPSFISENSETE